jgi:hypothetical protein
VFPKTKRRNNKLQISKKNKGFYQLLLRELAYLSPLVKGPQSLRLAVSIRPGQKNNHSGPCSWIMLLVLEIAILCTVRIKKFSGFHPSL